MIIVTSFRLILGVRKDDKLAQQNLRTVTSQHANKCNHLTGAAAITFFTLFVRLCVLNRLSEHWSRLAAPEQPSRSFASHTASPQVSGLTRRPSSLGTRFVRPTIKEVSREGSHSQRLRG